MYYASMTPYFHEVRSYFKERVQDYEHAQDGFTKWSVKDLSNLLLLSVHVYVSFGQHTACIYQ